MEGKVFTEIMLAVITIIGALVSYYVIPWLKTLVTEQQLGQLAYYVSIAVRCAEQIYPVEEWMQKKAYAMKFVRNELNEMNISVTDEQISAMIEAMVHEVKKDRDSISVDPRLTESLY